MENKFKVRRKREVEIKEEVNQKTLWIKLNDNRHINIEYRIKIEKIKYKISIRIYEQ